LRVDDGNTDLEGIGRALAAAAAETRRPTFIVVRTTIGYGSPHKAGTSAAHGSPLGKEEVALTKKALGWEWEQPFFIPPEALAEFRGSVGRGEAARTAWQRRFDAYAKAHPDLAEEWRAAVSGQLPAGWDSALPSWKAGQSEATRVAGSAALNAIAAKV